MSNGVKPIIGGNVAELRADLKSPESGASLVEYQHSSETVHRTVNSKLSDNISVKDFGAKGDAITDDTNAIKAADSYCADNGLSLFFPRGVYIISSSIESFADWYGEGAPAVGTFPLLDDKMFMVQGQPRTKIPGSTLLFQGTANGTFTTLRSDRFASMRYVIKKTGRSSYRSAPGLVDMGIVLDFDFKTSAGVVTLPNNDNSADADVGLLLHNVELKNIRNVCVGGYWKKAGVVHFGIDPDNTHMTELRTMGDIGLAIIGDTTGTNSGLNMNSCFIGANDHHSRSITSGNERWGTCALYIDIPSSTGLGSRNGITMIGGAVTTKTNYPIQLDRCGAINFTNVVFENATQVGSGTGVGQAGGLKRFIGTANTNDISFVNCRLNAEQIKSAGCLLDTATNATINIIGGNTSYGIETWKGLSGIKLQASATEQNLQLTNDTSSITTGVRFRRTSAGSLEMTIDGTRVQAWNSAGINFSKKRSVTASIVSNTITATSNVIRLSGGTVDLTTIAPSDDINEIKLLANTTSDIITLKTQTGNLRIGTDYVLSGFKVINLYYDGVFWLQDGGRG